MSSTSSIPALERIVFFNGQRLTAADLAALQRANRELRWLHNRSLHAWGIGIGFAVTGERGATSVTVGPGYAIDCLGREIILTESVSRTVPATAGTPEGGEKEYYLIAAYQADAAQQVTERRPGVCLPEGTVRLTEDPRIEWREPANWQEGFELILAQAFVQNCQLSRPLALGARRSARPSQHPYIAAGQTSAGETAWEALMRAGKLAGVKTVVDTSKARFGSTPQYFAHVVGERFIGAAYLAAIPVVAEATPEKFTLEVVLPILGQLDTVTLNPDQIDQIFNDLLQWHVVWMGVEG